MELEVVRAVYYGLKDATIGLNKQIDGIVIDQIGDLMPSHCAFYNYVDHPWVAQKTINREEVDNGVVIFPAIAVYLESAPQFDPEVITTDHRDGTFAIAISLLTIEPEKAKAMREALYTNRALLRFLTQFNSNTYKDTLRLRNGVSLFVSTALTQYTPFDMWGDVLLAASTVVTYRCREHQP